MTNIISFVSQKGGVGKSTLARALAREAAAAGLGVRVADLDVQQGTAVDWHRKRLERGFRPKISVEAYACAADALKLANRLDLAAHLDLLIIDGPARTSKATLEIAMHSQHEHGV